MGRLVDGKWEDVWYDNKSTKGKFVRQSAAPVFITNGAAIETATRKTYSGPLEFGQDLMTFVVGDEVSIMSREKP